MRFDLDRRRRRRPGRTASRHVAESPIGRFQRSCIDTQASRREIHIGVVLTHHFFLLVRVPADTWGKEKAASSAARGKQGPGNGSGHAISERASGAHESRCTPHFDLSVGLARHRAFSALWPGDDSHVKVITTRRAMPGRPPVHRSMAHPSVGSWRPAPWRAHPSPPNRAWSTW